MQPGEIFDSEQLVDTPIQSLFNGHLLVKSVPDGETWRFSGIASDEEPDVEGDAILKKAIDLSYAQKRGYVNWDHSRIPEDQIGFLTKATIIEGDQLKELSKRLGINVSRSASVYVEGEMYQHVDRALAVQKILKSIPEGAPGLGLSLDGSVARDAKSGGVLRAFVRGVAITPAPAHTKTLCRLLKSLRDHSGGQDGKESPINGRIESEELVKSIEQGAEGMTRDEATLWVLKKRPHWTYEFASKVVDFTISRRSRT